MMTLIDSNVLLDLATRNSEWYSWSAEQVERVSENSAIAINPLIYAEISVSYKHIKEVENAYPSDIFLRLPIPYEAAFLAGKAHRKYKMRGGSRTSTLPDFFIGAHAAISKLRVLTRDPRRFRQYFPSVELIAPGT